MRTLRAGLSLVEVIVALVVVGVAGAALVTALAADLRLRALAADRGDLGRRALDRLEFVSVRPCGRDTAGVAAAAWGSESWRAVGRGRTWVFTDSFMLRRTARAVAIEARLPCPE